MPFMSFQVSAERALENAGKLIKDGGFESVKLEGGEEVAEHVRRIVAAGIPVMGHVGLTPQSVHAMGGFKVQGKDAEAAEPGHRGRAARSRRPAPTPSCWRRSRPIWRRRSPPPSPFPPSASAPGPACDGQVLVCYDLLGMYPDLKPKFAKRFAEVGEQIIAATQAYVGEVQGKTFPAPEHTFKPSGIRRSLPSAPQPVLTADEIPPHWQTH